MSNIFVDFLLHEGLYKRQNVNKDNISDLIELVRGNVKINCHCKECGEQRIFTSQPILYQWKKAEHWHSKLLADEISRLQAALLVNNVPVPGTALRNNVEKWEWISSEINEVARVLVFKFICSLDETHHLDYIVLANNNEIVKIGQYPSVADLAFPELKRYEKVCSKEDMKEFKRAIGLSAQGIGVGAYVYLRRIIERLIEEAKEIAIEENVIAEEQYIAAQSVGEKVILLKQYLPKMLVENKVIYGIVSKGIHGLSEKECIEYFPILQECIIMILEQWEESRRKSETENKITSAISKISTNIN